MRMNSPSRTPRPPGANSARKPARYDAVNTATASAGREPDRRQQPPRQAARARTRTRPTRPCWRRCRPRCPRRAAPRGARRRAPRAGAARRRTGGHSSSPTPATDAGDQQHQRELRRPDAPPRSRARPVRPATAAPVPMASTCSTTADPVAAQGATPARCAMSAMPATAHTFPGRYLPRLDTVQMRAAPQPSRRWPQPASIVRQATMRMAYMSPHDERAQDQPARLDAPSRAAASAARSQLRVRLRTANADDGEPDQPLATAASTRRATHPAPRDTTPRTARRRGRARAAPARTRPPAAPGTAGRGPAAGRARRRSAPRRRAA